ncbi:right-handed parallel beta-helix repeat-containing protein [Aquimarina sp. ERC-38]|uniref:beta strand repeat-containing protein n=1 Tax=Aquimarina sp. ERC-38 TaxID=2949996 RepID=UPI002248716C|nr:Calx-beta domain-containing protein [Aquimarina sp. ERC-38]UZO80728.1 right-handed parallel beta-helix repeat-containing protein [Aquimarina sp. ERC-38]
MIVPIKTNIKYLTILMTLSFVTITQNLWSQDTYRDNFNGVSYNRNNGNQNWNGAWYEGNGETTDPNNGRIRIVNNQLRFRNLDNAFIGRNVDLSGYEVAILTLNYNRTNGSENILLWLLDGTGNFQSIQPILTGNTGTFTYFIPAIYLHTNSAIAFNSATGDWGDNNTIFFDNVQITAYDATISINNVSVTEDVGSTNFTVSLEGNTAAFSIDYNFTNGTATNTNDFNGTNGTLNFNANASQTRTINAPIINDTAIENDELFLVNLTNLSNGNVYILKDEGRGNIIDNDGFIIEDGITVNSCNNGFADTGGTNANYSDNENITFTICPDSADRYVEVLFNSFDLENGFDFLRVYNGTSTSAPLIGAFTGTTIPTGIISGDSSGCLTFQFISDNIINNAGWDATINCKEQFLEVSDLTVNENAGTATFTITLIGSNTASPFTVDYQTQDGTALADSDYVSVNGSLNFNGTTGQSRTVTVPIINNNIGEDDEVFSLVLSNSSNTNVGLSNGTATITDDGDTPVNANVPLTLFDEFNGYYDYALTGDTFRNSASDLCSIKNSSNNINLTTVIPGTATIRKAYLLWSHSGDSADDVVTFEGQQVSAFLVNKSSIANRQFYGMVGDVTNIINNIPDPSSNLYDFSGLSIDTSNFYCGAGVTYGGWSLMIFYTDPSFPAVGINFYNGFNSQQGTASTSSSTNYTLDGFYAIDSMGAKTTVLSWEGDVGLANNESLTISNGAGTVVDAKLIGDGNNNGTSIDNPFNSTLFDNTDGTTVNRTTLGMDLDTYDISPFIAAGESSVTTTVNVGQDFVILNAVLLKVPSNLISGFVFEDVNYPGGNGRNMASSSGLPVANAVVELYDNTGTFLEDTTTDASGEYTFGGMADGTYSVRVVNNTVKSNRGGGATCTTCLPVQTFTSDYLASAISEITTKIGGENPGGTDGAAGNLTNAQSIGNVTINSEGAVNLNFGFNFNTIVNTNASGQGSLRQFVINSNALDENGLNIEANSIFNPNPGEDVSIFMIPPTGDPLGRTADSNFNAGYFDIHQNTAAIPIITDNNAHVDGRTQTAFSGDTNIGTAVTNGSVVGTSATTLPSYDRPEIQVRRNGGDVFKIRASNTVIRNLSVFGGNRRAIRHDSGTNNLILQNFLGADATGVRGTVTVTTYMDEGVEIRNGEVVVDGNYIAFATDQGVFINGGNSALIQNNYLTDNGFAGCGFNLDIRGGNTIRIENNWIENAASYGINENIGRVIILNNTITENGGKASCANKAGIRLNRGNSEVSENIIYANGGSGIIITNPNLAGNRISQNSIYANGTATPSLGIDINNNGVTKNDTGDADGGPNGSLNFPIIESATLSGSNLRIIGWARPGTLIEVFSTDIQEASANPGDNTINGPVGTVSRDYGEGQIYLGSGTEGSSLDTENTASSYNDVDGNQDNTNKFHLLIPLSQSISVGSLITATGTLNSSTSEFSPEYIVKSGRLITNRRITYRTTPPTN